MANFTISNLTEYPDSNNAHLNNRLNSISKFKDLGPPDLVILYKQVLKSKSFFSILDSKQKIQTSITCHFILGLITDQTNVFVEYCDKLKSAIEHENKEKGTFLKVIYN